MKNLLLVIALVPFLSGTVFGNSATDSLIEKSYQQTQEGDLDQALITLEQAVKQDPDSSLARTRLGGVRVLRQEYSAGIKDFQQAIMLDQSNASAFVGMAIAYLHMGQYSLAEAALDEAGKLDPAKKPEIAEVQAWINQRMSGTSGSAH